MNFSVLDDNNQVLLNKEKVSWEGKKISKGVWYDETLFTLGGFDFTAKGILASGAIAGIVIAVLFCICCACSWWKRKKLVKLMTKNIGDKLKLRVIDKMKV